MTPTKLKNLLMAAALLLSIYWSWGQPDATGLAFALGLLLGAGSLRYRRGGELVVPVALLALAVGVLEARQGAGPAYLLGWLVGSFAPLGASRWLG